MTQIRRAVGAALVLDFPRDVDFAQSTMRIMFQVNDNLPVTEGRGPRFGMNLKKITELTIAELGYVHVKTQNRISLKLTIIELDLKWKLLRGLTEVQLHADARTTLDHELEVLRGRNCKIASWTIPSILDILGHPDPDIAGAPIVSPSFALAGIDQVQLIFYPKGYQPTFQDACGVFVC
ncbi:unnamed protein product, partial [Amoebophrya sp. A25]|eukprot:GSA25T00000848001.1